MTPPMPQDAELRAFIAQSEALYPPESGNISIAESRRLYDRMCVAFRAPIAGTVRFVEEMIPADGPTRHLPIRRYSTRGGERRAVIVLYLHGGGFVLGGLDSHHDVCAELCAGSGLEVVALDYRLAPEHVYPAALDDTETVLHTLAHSGRRVIVVGDSAGGNLAAALGLRCRRKGTAVPTGQILIYPALGGDTYQGSYVENAAAPMLTTAECRHCLTLYAGGSLPSGDPEFAPLAADDFGGLPPTVLVSADLDPVRDDAAAFAARLEAYRVPITYWNEPELVHGYLRARHTVRRAANSFERIVVALRRLADDAEAAARLDTSTLA
jgi:acetyl esterase